MFQGREYLTLHGEGPSNSMEFIAQALGDSLSNTFEKARHEYAPALKTLALEAETSKRDSRYNVIEALHKAAFKDGLGNPLLVNDWLLNKYSLEDVLAFK